MIRQVLPFVQAFAAAAIALLSYGYTVGGRVTGLTADVAQVKAWVQQAERDRKEAWLRIEIRLTELDRRLAELAAEQRIYHKELRAERQ